jgi:hypothetical protein
MITAGDLETNKTNKYTMSNPTLANQKNLFIPTCKLSTQVWQNTLRLILREQTTLSLSLLLTINKNKQLGYGMSGAKVTPPRSIHQTQRNNSFPTPPSSLVLQGSLNNPHRQTPPIHNNSACKCTRSLPTMLVLKPSCPLWPTSIPRRCFLSSKIIQIIATRNSRLSVVFPT